MRLFGLSSATMKQYRGHIIVLPARRVQMAALLRESSSTKLICRSKSSALICAVIVLSAREGLAVYEQASAARRGSIMTTARPPSSSPEARPRTPARSRYPCASGPGLGGDDGWKYFTRDALVVRVVASFSRPALCVCDRLGLMIMPLTSPRPSSRPPSSSMAATSASEHGTNEATFVMGTITSSSFPRRSAHERDEAHLLVEGDGGRRRADAISDGGAVQAADLTSEGDGSEELHFVEVGHVFSSLNGLYSRDCRSMKDPPSRSVGWVYHFGELPVIEPSSDSGTSIDSFT